jgi:hypothetical protein
MRLLWADCFILTDSDGHFLFLSPPLINVVISFYLR